MADEQPTFPINANVLPADDTSVQDNIDTIMPMLVKITERIYRDYGIVFNLSNHKIQKKFLTLYNTFMDLDFEEHAVAEFTRTLEHQYFYTNGYETHINLGAMKKVQKVECIRIDESFTFLEVPGVETIPYCKNEYKVLSASPFEAQHLTFKIRSDDGYLLHIISMPLDHF